MKERIKETVAIIIACIVVLALITCVMRVSEMIFL